MVYNDKHRAFLQAMMSGGIVQDLTAQGLCAQIFDENTDMSSIISKINDKLSPIAMCLKSGMCEITGQKYWAVVGTTHEDSVTIQSEYNVGQRAFLRAVYSEIVNSEYGNISSTDCLNLANNLDAKFTKTEADVFLKKLSKGRWLHCQDGVYYMGIRSIIEMMPYFRATYQEGFHNCQLCKDVLFHGFRCEHCDKDYHFYCISRKIAEQGENKCPNCSKNMDCTEIIEFNNTLRQNETQAQQNSGDEEEPMDVSDEPEDEPVFSQPLAAPRKSKRRTRANE